MNKSRVNFDVLTPVNFLVRSAQVYPDKVAVVHGEKRYTYREFRDRVNRLANALTDKGLGKGDKVAFFCPNIPPMLEAHYAVPMIGGALVSINTRLSSNEIAYIITHSDAKAVFVDNDLAPSILPVLEKLKGVRFFVNICDISPEKPLDGPDYESFLAAGSSQDPEIRVDEEYQLATINYTSGTTGQPKGVMYHHRGAYLNALGEIQEAGMTCDSVYLWTLPMFHCNGWCFTWAVTAIGGTHVCLRQLSASDIFRLINEEKVSHMCAAPTILIMMISHPEAKQFKIKQSLTILTAGAPPSPTVIEQMESMGALITHVYGLTEVYGPHSVCARQDSWSHLEKEELARIKSRQGVAYITAQYMDVMDMETMEPVPRDGKTMGEIVMRGNNVMLGYYKDPQATEKAFHGGWFHSGDLAVIHPDGYVQIMDRGKDIIISGGENISSVELENTIYRHPDVLEVAVVSSPDSKWGEVPKAFVTLKPGTNPSPQAIIEFCKDNLARFKAPKDVVFCDLPKTATGKILKFKLREKEWEGHDRKVN
ncbi:MAG: acyl--CoA ligase family protein [Proteobacteria bacterium]|nr:acyl--CoA ligase family protein [Pseudomonadota bacterium]